MARITVGAIGAYPDDPYYDPNRPSWLPYWIDTYEEGKRKYQAHNPVEATANAVGWTTGWVLGQAANTAGQVAGAVTEEVTDNLNFSGLAILAIGGFIAYKYLTR